MKNRPMMPSPSVMSKWDARFFGVCDLLASWSEDQSRKVGAVIVGPANEIRATGYNGLPRGVNGNVDERHSRSEGEKYYWFEHAERNAIFNAARVGVSIEGCRIYTSLFPCSDCLRGIIQSGIAQLNTYNRPLSDVTFERSFQVAFEMLMEANIDIRIFSLSKISANL